MVARRGGSCGETNRCRRGKLDRLGENCFQQVGEAQVEVIGAQGIVVRLALLGGVDDTGFAQDAQVVRERTARRFAADIAAAERATVGNLFDNRQTGCIAQGVQDLREVDGVGVWVRKGAHKDYVAWLYAFSK